MGKGIVRDRNNSQQEINLNKKIRLKVFNKRRILHLEKNQLFFENLFNDNFISVFNI